jgi:signal transduction histidine kinase
MKKTWVTIIFLIPLIAFAITKTDSIVYVGKIPSSGFLLNKGWKFHPGDNPEWAKPVTDGSNWPSINPSADIFYLPQVTKAELGWFRLKLHFDTALVNKSLAINISQVGASEIYLNGRLIYRFGTVAKDYETEQTQVTDNKPISIRFDSQATQVIAVRYSFNNKNIFINYLAPNLCLRLTLNDTNKAFARFHIDHEANSVELSIITTLYLLLGVMSLFLYFSFRIQKAYLYLGIICLFAAGSIAFAIVDITFSSETVLLVSALSFCSYIFEVTSVIVLLQFVHLWCGKRKGPTWYALIFYAALSIPALIFLYKWSAIICFSFFVLNYFEVLRLLLTGIRNKTPGTLILFMTYAFAVVLTILFIVELAAGKYQLADFDVTLALVIVPIGLSIFLASGYAKTGHALQDRVVEVEQLSEKTIAQEQEKQQILASQNARLEKQVSERTAELNHSLNHLKATQNQLIQSEKMASLGELTAGIAHEIQNPLNFVNNFSDVSVELLDELTEEAKAGHNEDVIAIAADLTQNLQKINHHGKRADFIVKGMLQHSRISTGEKQLTNINLLADEFFKLSYHGLRAKDKNFSAELVTNFDPDLPPVNIVQQDIGRVLLNLFNNAFYAVAQKAKTGDPGYKPTVEVTTLLEGDQIAISVKDNGMGIPDAIKEKIMQPFFTTKPTGEGTGLGLSLSYDIVVKGHGGNIAVETNEGEYSTFKIILSLT